MPAAVRKNQGVLKHWYVAGPLTGIVVGLLALYGGALLLSGDVLPPTVTGETAVAAVFLGGTAGGVAAAKKRGCGALAAGTAAGALCFAVLALAAVLAPEGRLFSDGCLRMLICTLGGGAFGGALCIRGRQRRTRKRRSGKRG